ncbi:MAG: hypothetical protein QXP49_07005 [Nitrososphaerota archaeon]
MLLSIRLAAISAAVILSASVASYITYRIQTATIVKLKSELNICMATIEEKDKEITSLGNKIRDLESILEENNKLCSKRVGLYTKLTRRMREVSGLKGTRDGKIKTASPGCDDDICSALNSMFK